ncbi:hypothetical protein F4212_10400, partial [Candidatus Poribacteria bacterium]|nr:hypothetical protein [Candidatus Poribacteria bacterium]
MAVDIELQYAKLDELYLDPKNPRLGRHNVEAGLSQDEILEKMRDWVLDELAESYLESGFWTHEALLVTKEKLGSESCLVVIEGNRRLAALKYLHAAFKKKDVPIKWKSLVEGVEEPKDLFKHIPCVLVGSRQEIESFLGFRHVTGIKEWNSEEKAQYIARLIDERGMTYEEVRRKIGSKTPTVQQNYISYRLLLQMEDSLEDFSPEDVRGRFSVLYLALRTPGVQTYLDIDISTDIGIVQRPVPTTHLDALANFARWLFGNKQNEEVPLFTDSRRVNDFGKILESPEAIEYLQNKKKPDFDYAFQLAGGEEFDLVELLSEAASNVKYVLSRVHHYKESETIQDKT